MQIELTCKEQIFTHIQRMVSLYEGVLLLLGHEGKELFEYNVIQRKTTARLWKEQVPVTLWAEDVSKQKTLFVANRKIWTIEVTNWLDYVERLIL